MHIPHSLVCYYYKKDLHNERGTLNLFPPLLKYIASHSHATYEKVLEKELIKVVSIPMKGVLTNLYLFGFLICNSLQ